MPESPHEFADAARRCSDRIRLDIVAGNAGKYAAIRLSDGGSDGVCYDTRRDAIRHQLHETLCAYVKIPADDMPPEDAAIFLQMHRKVYDAGHRFIDPDGPEILTPFTREEMIRALKDVNRLRVGYRGN